jgi:hypothetical protein
MSKDIQIYPTEVTGANVQPRSIMTHREPFAMIAIVLSRGRTIANISATPWQALRMRDTFQTAARVGWPRQTYDATRS